MSDPPVPSEVLPDQTNRDDFAFNLRASSRAAAGWGPRYLWTWQPTAATNASGMQTRLSSAVTGSGAAVLREWIVTRPSVRAAPGLSDTPRMYR